MTAIVKSVTELIGNTPLMELTGIERKYGLKARLLAKLEYLNPTGSTKDRAAFNMILEAEQTGVLKPGAVIIEPTSGNTGIGLAACGTARGYRVIIVMPETFSIERRKLIKAYGAEIVLSEGSKGMAGAIEKAQQLADSIPGSFIPEQFDNPANANAHYLTTGPEIWKDTDGNVDILVSAVGTGGTITGTGRYLRQQNPSVRVIAVEPAKSPLLSGGKAGPHGIQGIGANFIPSVLDTSVYDEVVTVTDEDAYETSRNFGRTEGILVGISSGAALWAAVKQAQKPENEGKTIVVILPDSGDRYLSTSLFEE